MNEMHVRDISDHLNSIGPGHNAAFSLSLSLSISLSFSMAPKAFKT